MRPRDSEPFLFETLSCLGKNRAFSFTLRSNTEKGKFSFPSAYELPFFRWLLYPGLIHAPSGQGKRFRPFPGKFCLRRVPGPFSGPSAAVSWRITVTMTSGRQPPLIRKSEANREWTVQEFRNFSLLPGMSRSCKTNGSENRGIYCTDWLQEESDLPVSHEYPSFLYARILPRNEPSCNRFLPHLTVHGPR